MQPAIKHEILQQSDVLSNKSAIAENYSLKLCRPNP
jgi:hypothetical protein